MHAYFYGTQKPLPAEFDNYFDITDTVVIEMDMCRGHLDEGPGVTCPCPRGREIIDPVNRFNQAARELGIPVIHMRAVNRKGGIDDVNGNRAAWRQVFPMTVGPIPNADMHNIEGSKWCEFVVDVAESDLTVNSKKRLSAFYPTDLEFLLRNLRRNTLIITGLMTDCCVLNSAFDGSNRGFQVVVPRDLTRGFNLELEDAALKIISLHLGLVVDSQDLIAMWHRT
ncbi:cysteine hydrolase [Chloroflexi bacterium TSY]|nr:cysteine hydrolase [Chloroflexi bacterium TSY]